MRKFMCAAIVTVCAVGLAAAEDLQVLISKIEDGKVTYKKTEKGKATGDDLTATLAKDAKIYTGKGTFDKESKTFKVEKGDVMEKDAVAAAVTKGVESKAKGARAQISIEGTSISQVIILGKKKKGT